MEGYKESFLLGCSVFFCVTPPPKPTFCWKHRRMLRVYQKYLIWIEQGNCHIEKKSCSYKILSYSFELCAKFDIYIYIHIFTYIYIYIQFFSFYIHLFWYPTRVFHPQKRWIPPSSNPKRSKLGGQVRGRCGGYGPRRFRGHWRKGGTTRPESRKRFGCVFTFPWQGGSFEQGGCFFLFSLEKGELLEWLDVCFFLNDYFFF